MQVVCDKCGAPAEIPDELEESTCPPKGWRVVRVTIEVYTGPQRSTTTVSEGLHVCPACVKDQKPDAQIDVAVEVLRQNGCAAR